MCSGFVQKLVSVQSSGINVGFFNEAVGVTPVFYVRCKIEAMFVKVCETATYFSDP